MKSEKRVVNFPTNYYFISFIKRFLAIRILYSTRSVLEIKLCSKIRKLITENGIPIPTERLQQ